MSKLSSGITKRELLERAAKNATQTPAYLESSDLTNGKTARYMSPDMVKHLKQAIVDQGSLNELGNTPNGHLQEYFDKVGNELTLESVGIAEFHVPMSTEEQMAQHKSIEDLKRDQDTLSKADEILKNAGELTEASIDDWKHDHSGAHGVSNKSRLG